MATAHVPISTAGTAGVVVAGTGHSEVAGATDNNTMPNNGHLYVLLRNSGASSRTFTPTPKVQVDGGRVTVTGQPVTVVAGASRLIGPFPKEIYGTTLEFVVSHAELVVTGILMP
jgi:hypothetical protein